MQFKFKQIMFLIRDIWNGRVVVVIIIILFFKKKNILDFKISGVSGIFFFHWHLVEIKFYCRPVIYFTLKITLYSILYLFWS